MIASRNCSRRSAEAAAHEGYRRAIRAGEELSLLQGHIAAAEHDHLLGQAIEREQRGAVDEDLVVEGHFRRLCRLRTRRDEEGVAGNPAARLPVTRHLHRVGIDEGRLPLDGLDAVTLQVVRSLRPAGLDDGAEVVARDRHGRQETRGHGALLRALVPLRRTRHIRQTRAAGECDGARRTVREAEQRLDGLPAASDAKQIAALTDAAGYAIPAATTVEAWLRDAGGTTPVRLVAPEYADR